MSENETSFYNLKDDVQQAFLFRDHVKNLLYQNIGEDVATVSDELAIKSLRYVLDSLQIHKDNDSNYSAKDREIERLKRCMSGIASFLDLPSDVKQPDICQAIMQLKEKCKNLSREPLSNEQIIITDLRHDLRVANKVIARLVGE